MTSTTINDLPLQTDASLNDYFQLLKPRVMLLVVFTGFAGLWLAPGHVHPLLSFVAVLCIALSAGGAGAINMWWERGIDAKMRRTQNRPLPMGRVTPDDALALGIMCIGASVALMGLALNWVAGGLLLTAALFYIFIYTIWLKPRTPQNIVIGGAAGAFPPMIGWAAVTGDVTLAPLLLFLIIFFWTPPHFWALSLYAQTDYDKAGIPMLPNVAGEAVTKNQMLLYTLALIPLSFALYFIGLGSVLYLAGAALLNALFLVAAIRVHRDKSNHDNYQRAKQMFGYSIFYLFMMFLLLMLDHGLMR